jgi:hypothetical protein
MPVEAWARYTVEELAADKAKQQEIFEIMLRRLEDEGRCRGAFHQLAFVLFNDTLGDS